MRQFKTWTNNLEREPVKPEEEKLVIQRVEYRNVDRIEKSINTTCYLNKSKVTKAYKDRIEMKPFGIGNGFEDLKANSACSTVQKENVW